MGPRRIQVGLCRFGLTFPKPELRKNELTMRRVQHGSSVFPSFHTLLREVHASLKRTEPMHRPATALLSHREPLRQAVLLRHLDGFRGKSERGCRLVMILQDVRCSAQRPGKTVGV